MRERIIKLTSGWIPVSMLCLFAVVVANGDEDVETTPRLDRLSLNVQQVLAVPDQVERVIDGGLHAPIVILRKSMNDHPGGGR